MSLVFRLVLIVFMPSCLSLPSKHAASNLADDVEGPYFTCGESGIDIEVYASSVVIVRGEGSDAQRYQRSIVPATYSSRSEDPEIVCGSASAFSTIKIYDDGMQVGYKVSDEASSFEWLQYRFVADEAVDVSETEEPSLEAEWLRFERPAYSIFYAAGYEDDRDEMDRYMAHAVQAATREFADHDAQGILRGIDAFDVYVHPEPTDTANDGIALLEFVDAIGKTSRLHFLAPSAHTPGLRPNLDSYIRKTVIHEYMTVYLVQVVHNRSGWRDLYTAPGWFVQGYQEYLGLIHGDIYSRDVTLPSYIDSFKADSERIRISTSGIEVENDYYDGTVLLHFMHETYGRSAVQRVLTSAEGSFEDALESEIGSYETISRDFSVWRRGL